MSMDVPARQPAVPELMWSSTHHDVGVSVIVVGGELDTATAPALDAVVVAAVARRVALLIIDLTEVTFLSSAGLEVLVHAHTVASGVVRVVADGPATARPIQVLGLDDVLNLYPTVDAARHDPLPPLPTG